MNLGAYVILVVFAAFIILLFLNPNLSCFGKKIRSPLYTRIGRKKTTSKKIVTEDYGFKLVENDGRETSRPKASATVSAGTETNAQTSRKKPLKTEDYGFKLDE
ncbi:MAG: hypothetical protein KJ908_05740 [Acidobacteria bacterium]|nr:hypothetical protein [Acidobacteriota bacterium]